ncbi:hypothetical protein E2E30_03365 [Sphingomonas sp. AAP5]|uniref:Glycosyltransferase RgtA/B/C/D-like domain-containing protein n=1 Tax=Sphingomonas glacialis TaxID=658225 RepID=A0ABQ3LNG0_9SPHN|nr:MULTISPECIES: hypothetical protein [Sphingomonas]QBM74904.1 hypothetical protein E2E30_03365 [Sphingomonas sp. AAP5]GHH20661.1 hypothetical protein GCM10008023_28820 [Sphingomonas glacialis]
MQRQFSFFLAAIMLLGLGLRTAAATGGLWLDEAWSAELAHMAGTPLGVFLKINHDNNHHLNSLWLQFVGFDAPPLLQRALSIVAGTLAIPVAAEIFRRRSHGIALIAALLFAVSPMVVTMGSEARGYAGMSLALLLAILLIDRWLVDERGERTRMRLALCFALGALSQLTMLFGCIALIGWVCLTLYARHGVVVAARRALVLFFPAVITLGIVLGVLAGAALASPLGFQFGDYKPFELLLFLHAIVEMLGYTIGWPIVSLWLMPAALILVVLARRLGTDRAIFYTLAIAAFPVTLAILHAGNPGHPRYYLVAALALLLLIAEASGTMIARGGWHRGLALLALAGITAGSLWQDVDLIRNQRGDPTQAIIAMRARAPRGGVVVIDRWMGQAMLEVAAAHLHYPIRVLAPGCKPVRFLFVDRFKGETFPVDPVRCGVRYRAFASARAHGLSGSHWTLYERRP